VLVLFFVYEMAIKETINMYNTYSEGEKKIALAASAPMLAAQLEKKLMQIDIKLGNENKKKQNTADALLELTTNYCQNNHAVLREFPKTTIIEQGDMTIETNQFIVEGDFVTLINLVYILEQKNKLGKVASVKYQLKKDFKTKEMVLTAAIYVQNVKKKQHEK
jgi:hypothetical protein